MTKRCHSCKQSKSLSEFGRDSTRKDGLHGKCKSCKIIYSREYNRNNSDLLKQKKRRYYANNKDKWVQRREARRDEIREYNRVWQAHKYHNDPIFRLKAVLRSRLQNISNGRHAGSAVRDLGCSVEQLKRWIEQQFQYGMTWDNYGQWHIDHIVPLSSFDLTQNPKVKKACHWFNLQPLWAQDNLSKGARF